jgi:hypothetical protein
MFTILEQLKLQNYKLWCQGHFNGMTCLLNFMKNYELLQKLLQGTQKDGQTAQ